MLATMHSYLHFPECLHTACINNNNNKNNNDNFIQVSRNNLCGLGTGKLSKHVRQSRA